MAVRQDYPAVIAAGFAALLAIGCIYSLARRLGSSVFASASAGAISVGCGMFAISLYTAGAEMLLSGAFFGASVVFLMDVWRDEQPATSKSAELACSVFLFMMACGAKNPTTLLAPFYLLFLAVAFYRARQRQSAENRVARKMIMAVVTAGVAGLACSGVAWNYESNKLFFGDKGLPRLMKSTLSHDFGPRDAWTRLCRGAVLIAYDTLWVPKFARGQYGAIAENTLKMLGGKASIPEDDKYFYFKPDPMKGLGLVGIFIFVPALIFACARSARTFPVKPKIYSTSAFNELTLTILTIAAFFMCHLVLRWQSIGMIRLMFPMVVIGLPLAALLLEKRILRTMALALLVVTAAIFFVYWSGIVSRRIGRKDGAFFKAISKLQNEHASVLHYQWKDHPLRERLRREDYTFREVYSAVLEGFQQPCTIGFIGNENSECLYLFGKYSQNRIIPLVDARDEDQIMNVSADNLDYVVVADKFEQAKAWAQAHGFEQILTCTDEKGELVLAFRNRERAASVQ